MSPPSSQCLTWWRLARHLPTDEIERFVQVVHSAGFIRSSRLATAWATTVLSHRHPRGSDPASSLVRCKLSISTREGQVERRPHALRDPRGLGDRFRAGTQDRLSPASSSGAPRHGWIGGPAGPGERGLRHPQRPLIKGGVRRRSAPRYEDDRFRINWPSNATTTNATTTNATTTATAPCQ